MKEAETINVFVKAMYSLKCKKVLNPSIPKGSVELHINPEDDEALKNMNLTEKMTTHAASQMLLDLHTHHFSKEATDRVLQDAKAANGSSRSWFRVF